MINPQPPTTFVAPQFDWWALTPILIVAGAAVLGIILEALLPRRGRAATQAVLAVLALVVSLLTIAMQWGGEPRGIGEVAGTGGGPGQGGPRPLFDLVIDGPALLLQGTIVLLSLLAIMTIVGKGGDSDSFAAQASSAPGSDYEKATSALGWRQTEIVPLIMFSVTGMMVFTAAADLLTMFIALEVLSLPLYVLTSMARRRRMLSQEAALKYFLLGAFASAIFLFGAALLYAPFGTLNVMDLAPTLAQAQPSPTRLGVVMVGITFVIVGLLFKIGVAPFHSWVPDVYSGAPTPVTGFMAACTKIAAVGALINVLLIGLGGIAKVWEPIVLVTACLTLVVGAVVGIRQGDIKRVLAYSSVAHAGFILIALNNAENGQANILFYLITYGLTTIGAFAVVAMVRHRDADGAISSESTSIASWAGLGRRSPWLATAMTVFLLAMTGIPLTSGFIAKFAVLQTGFRTGHTWLVVVAVLSSAITAFYYLRIIRAMFFCAEEDENKSLAVSWQPLSAAAVGVCLIATLVIGILPGPVMNLTKNAVEQSRIQLVTSPR